MLLAYIDPTPPDVAAARCASLFRLYSDPDTELLNMADFIDVCCCCLFVVVVCLFVDVVHYHQHQYQFSHQYY